MQNENRLYFKFYFDYCHNWTDQIKQYRKRNKLTQAELSEITGIPIFTIRCWELGKNKPPFKKWRQLEVLFNSKNS